MNGNSQNMKKVLFLIHDLGQGGAEKVLVNLVNNMDTNKFHITVMTLFDEGVNRQFLKPHITYKSCFKRAIPGNSHYMKLLSPKFLYKWLIKDDYDVVVSYLEGPSARIVAGAPKNIKVASWIHSTVNEKGFTRAFRNGAEAKRCYRRADRMVFVSKGVMDAFQKCCQTQSNALLYNTVESDLIIDNSKNEVSEFDKTDAAIRMVAVGTLKTGKGYERLLNISKRLKDDNVNACLYILGSGPLQNEIEGFIRDNNLHDNVKLLGYQTNPYKYVAKCDLFVCASHAEGFSTAATEALIVGTPVCTVEVSGMKEMLGENNEYGIVTENDENALYEGIKKLLDDPSLLAHVKKMGEIRGKTFSTENTVKAVEDMLLSL